MSRFQLPFGMTRQFAVCAITVVVGAWANLDSILFMALLFGVWYATDAWNRPRR